MNFTEDWVSPHIENWMATIGKYKGKETHLLEIGVFEGRATVWFFENILTHPESTHTAIDTFEGGDDQKKHGTKIAGMEERYLKNISKYLGQEILLKGRSEDILPTIKPGYYDIIYVDGSHVASDVLSDLVYGWRLLKGDGIMIMDDYWWPIETSKENRPETAINAWMECYKGKILMLCKSSQIIVTKK